MHEAKAASVWPTPQDRKDLEHFRISPIPDELAELQKLEVQEHETFLVSLRVGAEVRRLFVSAEERGQGGDRPIKIVRVMHKNDLPAVQIFGDYRRPLCGVFDGNRQEQRFFRIGFVFRKSSAQAGFQLLSPKKYIGRFGHSGQVEAFVVPGQLFVPAAAQITFSLVVFVLKKSVTGYDYWEKVSPLT